MNSHTPFLRRTMAVFAVTAVSILGASGSKAEVVTVSWTGSAGTDFETPDNWDPFGIPANNDFGAAASFAENSPANKTPKLTVGRSIHKIDFFDSVGWELGGEKQLILKVLSSSGSGTNSITARLKTAIGNYDWIIESGNTLKLASLIQDGTEQTLSLSGGGMLIIAGGIKAAYGPAVNAFRIDEGILQVDTSTPYRFGDTANSGAVTINSPTSMLRMKTSLADAQSQIGSKILDGTGRGLKVSDAGDGYVQISVNP